MALEDGINVAEKIRRRYGEGRRGGSRGGEIEVGLSSDGTAKIAPGKVSLPVHERRRMVPTASRRRRREGAVNQEGGESMRRERTGKCVSE